MISSLPRAGGAADAILLRTKLQLPVAPAGLVARPRLLARLDQYPPPRLTLIAAPAGSGKTALLGAWLAGGVIPTGWLSLDTADNDPARFWAYLLAALEGAHPSLAAEARTILRETGPGAAEAIAVGILNAAAALPARTLLILDDYHLIHEEAIHRALAFLIERLPPNLGVVIAARTDPPFALSRLRARRELVELRASDLRFTASETRTFLAESMGLPLGAEAVAALEARTEGWIVGLQLAALSMQGRDRGDLDRFVRAFTGSHRFVLDYLIEEVLSGQTEEVQQFLLATAVLDRLTAPLCAALLDELDGGDVASTATVAQAMLEQLEERALFLVPLDEERRWYRYHHLFADVLRARLRGTMPTLAPRLHRRASAWHERHGTPGEAIRHALAGDDVARAADLIDAHSRELLAQRRLVTLRGWIEALPEEAVRARPTLAVAHAWILLHAGQHTAVEQRLTAVERQLADPASGTAGADPLLDEVTVLRTVSAYARGTLSPGAARPALQALASTPPATSGIAALTLGVLHTRVGDIATADQALLQAVALGRATGDTGLTLGAMAGLARLCALRNQPFAAADLYREILTLAAESPGGPLPIAGQAHLGLAALLYEWHDLEEAERHSRQGLALARDGALAGVALFGHKVLSRILAARGAGAAALAELRVAESYCERADDVAEIAALRARFWLRAGDLAAASRWADATGITPDSVEADEATRPNYHPYELERLVVARIRAAEGRDEASRRILDSLLRRAEADRRVRSSIGILIVRAAVALVADREAAAVADIGRALDLGEPARQIYLFLNDGAPVATALRRWLAAHSRTADSARTAALVDYARTILRAFAADGIASEAIDDPAATAAIASAALPPPQPLAEPLSARELDVVRLLAVGRSNRAIADELFVTVGTVKKHLNNIFGKLEATNRTEVVARARALGLLH